MVWVKEKVSWEDIHTENMQEGIRLAMEKEGLEPSLNDGPVYKSEIKKPPRTCNRRQLDFSRRGGYLM